MFFCVSIHDHANLGFPKLAHMTLSLILMLSPNFNYLGLLFASYKQINLHLPKFMNKKSKTKVLRAQAKS